MRQPLVFTLCLGGAVLLAASGGAQPPGGGQVDVSMLGPQVGEAVPDFSAVDQQGHQQTLKSLMGPKGLMLVFSRSADW